ncbi:hypothetical protein NCI_02276 [Burkholderia pseudomallei]
MMPAAPKPWITRSVASAGSVPDSAQPSDAAVKSMSPAM